MPDPCACDLLVNNSMTMRTQWAYTLLIVGSLCLVHAQFTDSNEALLAALRDCTAAMNGVTEASQQLSASLKLAVDQVDRSTDVLQSVVDRTIPSVDSPSQVLSGLQDVIWNVSRSTDDVVQDVMHNANNLVNRTLLGADSLRESVVINANQIVDSVFLGVDDATDRILQHTTVSKLLGEIMAVLILLASSVIAVPIIVCSFKLCRDRYKFGIEHAIKDTGEKQEQSQGNLTRNNTLFETPKRRKGGQSTLFENTFHKIGLTASYH